MRHFNRVLAAGVLGVMSSGANAAFTVQLESGSSSILITDQLPGDLNPQAGVITYVGSLGSISTLTVSALSKPFAGDAGTAQLSLTTSTAAQQATTLVITATDDSYGPGYGSSTLTSRVGGSNPVGTSQVQSWLDATDAGTVAGACSPGAQGPFSGAFSNESTASCGVNGSFALITRTTVQLNPGSHSTDVNVLADIPQELAGLGDFVWEDGNRDGLQTDDLNQFEDGVANVTVELYSCDGTFLDDQTTGVDGSYLFSNLIPGSYYVQFLVPAGFDLTTQDAGDDALDSDADPFDGGRTSCVDLAPSETNRTVDAGLVRPLSALGDFVFEDVNGNGLQDPTEPGVPDVEVELYSCGDVLLDSTFTDVDGLYFFDNLELGDYYVRFILPDGFTFTTRDVMGAATDATDSDADQGTGETNCVTLDGAQPNRTLDAGLQRVPENAALGDLVFEDVDGNGLYDPMIDAVVPGVTVNLYDCFNNLLATDVTDSFGEYLFSDLVPGGYQVQFELPPGFDFTTANAGDDAADSDADENTGFSGCVTLAPGELNTTVDAGIVRPPVLAALGDFVWHDLDGDGIQDGNEPGIPGAGVELFDCNGQSIATDVTGANGEYLFDQLLPGSYYVIFTAPFGTDFVFTSQNNPAAGEAKDSDADPVTGQSDCVVLNEGDINRDVDAGFYLPAELGDTTFFDSNANGIQDAGDVPLSNVGVALYSCGPNGIANDGDDVFLTSTNTDGSGNYLFTGLAPGGYFVDFAEVAGLVFTLFDQGSDDSADSDAAPGNGRTICTMLESDETDLTWDAGYVAEPRNCAVDIDQTCAVPQPVVTGPFDCSGKVNSLSMIWDGSEDVTVTAWDGAVGSGTPLVVDQPVAVGGEITVADYQSSTNDVFWEVFSAATGQRIGTSKFHRSCSDDDMDGPEDCGLNQGNGKKDGGDQINDWLLEGLATSGGDAFDCTASPTPNDFPQLQSCEVIRTGADCATLGKPETLAIRYVGGDCSASNNDQDKASCDDFGALANYISLVITKDDDDMFLTPSSVALGEVFLVQNFDASSSLKSNLELDLRNAGGPVAQRLAIHTSCSNPLRVGDRFGSLEIVAFNGETGGSEVILGYKVSNLGDALTGVRVTDDLFGDVAGPFNLAAGAMASFTQSVLVTGNVVNRAVVTADASTTESCMAVDDLGVQIVEAPKSCDDGKPVKLVFEYTGESCGATTNTQEGKFVCAGDPGGVEPDAVEMTKDADKFFASYIPGSLPGEAGRVVIESRDSSDEFPSEIKFRLKSGSTTLQSLTLHASCSKALDVGDQFGSLVLEVFVPKS